MEKLQELKNVLNNRVCAGAYIAKELEPINSWLGFYRKSFYGKAIILSNDNYEILKSYNTDVAILDKSTNTMFVNGRYSATTARHINAFLHRHGLESARKKDMVDWKNYYTQKYL